MPAAVNARSRRSLGRRTPSLYRDRRERRGASLRPARVLEPALDEGSTPLRGASPVLAELNGRLGGPAKLGRWPLLPGRPSGLAPDCTTAQSTQIQRIARPAPLQGAGPRGRRRALGSSPIAARLERYDRRAPGRRVLGGASAGAVPGPAPLAHGGSPAQRRHSATPARDRGDVAGGRRVEGAARGPRLRGRRAIASRRGRTPGDRGAPASGGRKPPHQGGTHREPQAWDPPPGTVRRVASAG